MLHSHDELEVRRIELTDGTVVQGVVTEGFEPVLETFVENFERRHDLGAACAVYLDGSPVVDLWGGIADSRSHRPWDHDTAAVIFSCTKGILAVCICLLVQEGRLSLDAPVIEYWPEFGQGGKGEVTVRMAMSHRAGLASLDRDFTLGEVLAWEPVIRGIEVQRPHHPPGAGHMYHALTYGWIVGEIIHRVTGMLPGEYFRRTLGDPLELRTWIGLPASERNSVAWMEPPLPDEESEAARQAAWVRDTNPLVDRSFTMGGAFAFPAEDGYVTFNAPEIQAAQVPGANGISNACSLARLYAACVSSVGGPQLLRSEMIDDAIRVQSAGPQLTGAPDDGTRWGTGFQLASPPSCPMLGPESFGHAGAGGQLAFGDAAHRVGFAYLSNQMGGYGDARSRELTVALQDCLARRI